MKKIKYFFMALLICSSIFAASEIPPEMELLNDLTYYTTLIVNTENRLYLDDIYDRLLNQYENKEIDPEINNRMISIMDGIKNMQIIDLKKERLQVVFDLQKSSVIAAAIPNPVNMIGTIALSTSPFRSARQNIIAGLASAVGTGVSSYTMYKTASNNLLLDTSEKYWNLEYDEMITINDLNKQSLTAQNSYANANNIPSEYILNEEYAKKLTEIISDENKARALNDLVSYEEIYKYIPLYWLERAALYYVNHDYQSCIDTVIYYDKNFDYSQIYRRNERYGQILVDAIASAFMLYYDTDYDYCMELVIPWLGKAVESTAPDDWFQKYYIAISYLSFADDSHPEYYQKAYDLLCDNVRELSKEQDSLDSTYKNDLQEKTKEEKELMPKVQREEYETTLKEEKKARETELPPMNAGLIENLRFLYCLNSLGIGNVSDYNASIQASIVIPQLQDFLFGELYAEGDQFGFDKERFSVDKSLIGNKFTFKIPACFINSETIFYISINDAPYQQLYNSENLSKQQMELGYPEMLISRVDRNKSNNIADFDVKMTLEVPKEWVENTEDNNAKITLRVETAYCPIDIVFVGSKLSDLEFGWISKDYSKSSFYTLFNPQSVLTSEVK